MHPDEHSRDSDLRARREALQRALGRANTAGLVLVSAVILFALVAVVLAYHSHQNAARAEAGRLQAEQQLFEARLAQARALQLSRRIGQSHESLAALRTAAQLRPSADFLNDAIAALALPDFEEEDTWHPLPTNVMQVAVAAGLGSFAWMDIAGSIGVQRMSDGALVCSLPHAQTNGVRVLLSSNGRFVAAVGERQLKVWDTTAQQLTFEVALRGSSVAMHPIDNAIACRTEPGQVEIRRLEDGKVTSVLGDTGLYEPLAFNPATGHLAMTAPRKGVQIRELETGNITASVSTSAFRIISGSWSGDGRFLTLGVNAPYIYTWDTTTNDLRHMRGMPAYGSDSVRALLRPQGDWIVGGTSESALRVWCAVLGTELLLVPETEPIAFSPDGERLAVRGTRGIGILRMRPPDVVRTISIPPGYIADFEDGVVFSPDSRTLAKTGANGTWCWRLGDPPIFHRVDPDWCWWLRFSDANTLMAGGANLLWRGVLDSKGRSLVARTNLAPMGSSRLAFDDVTGAGDLAVAHKGSGGVVISLTGTGRDLDLSDHPEASGFVFSPNRKWIACGARHTDPLRRLETIVWSAQTGERLATFSGTGRSTVLFSPDNRWLLIGRTSDYRLVSTTTWNEVSRRPRRASGGVAAAAFSPDGHIVATHADDNTLAIHDVATGKDLFRLQAPKMRLAKRPAFSPDGRWLAAGTHAHLQLWDLQRLGERIVELGLQWPLNGKLAATVPPVAARRATRLEHGVVFVVLSMAAGALIFAALLRQYQKRMLKSYLELDALMTQRNEQLAQAQGELLHSQKMRALGTLAAGVAHDFNNLLSIIRMANKLTGEETRGNADVQENVALVDKTVTQGKAVVQSMLGYSRPSAERGLFSVAALVEQTVNLLHKEFLSGIDLKLDLDRNAPQVHGLSSRLEQALLNLIVNAAEAMQGKGSLRIATRVVTGAASANVLRPRAANAYVEIVVSDSGPGMSPAVRERIFEPFFTTKNVGNLRGTGLGLSMAYTIAQEEGFGLDVASSEGVGTEMRILVPVTASS